MQLVLLFFFSLTAIAAPRALLSETTLYSDILAKLVSEKNRSFSPQYPLWSDGALKKRWIYLPLGKQIDSSEEDRWVFPLGTKIWKEFSFIHPIKKSPVRVETRLIEKISEDEWEFSTYLWNEAETDALLAPEDGVKDYFAINQTVKHDIPSMTECQRCHKSNGDAVLGFDAIQLSVDRDPLAPHPDVYQPGMLTLKDLITEKLLSKVSKSMQEGAPKIPSPTKEGRAVLGYLHANCANCHNPQGSSKNINLNLRHVLSANAETELPAFKTTVNKLTQIFSIPNFPDTYRLVPKKPEVSAMVYMMENLGPSHMPPSGSKIVDEDALLLLKAWIRSL